ncbi:MAG: S8 family serine peptidase [Porphyromonadaceae bacterium]|nr:S8 family serine peptidase [Porphyromonadaceae bacterium]
MKPPILGEKRILPDSTSTKNIHDESISHTYVEETYGNPLYTGRYLLIIREGSIDVGKITKLLEKKWGLLVANTADFVNETIHESKIRDADALFYNELGVALLSADDDMVRRLHATTDYIIEPEKVVYIPDEISAGAVTGATWGIEAIKADESVYTGTGIKIAVLDTGLDMQHPDFKERNRTTFSFVPDESVEDLHGHGTHCVGIACGRTDTKGIRYGVATEADIYAGKVLSNRGSGAQAWVLDGMTWAANQGCHVLSMSLGSSVFPGQSYDIAYERAAQFALSKGTLIVAAAGNESRRSKNRFSPVGSPADCPSILAVGAIDSSRQIADFSNRAINKNGLVDIAAPGVSILSSWPLPGRYRVLSGTSMATPHVAGIIALLCEKFPEATPEMIIQKLNALAEKLEIPVEDVGAGLAIAP